ncbi:hypothetical protein [Marinibacterium sp. SX1]
MATTDPARPWCSRSRNPDAHGRAIEVNRGCWPFLAVEMVFGDR